MNASDLLKMFSAPAPKEYKRREGAGYYGVDELSPRPEVTTVGTLAPSSSATGTPERPAGSNIPAGVTVLTAESNAFPLTKGSSIAGMPASYANEVFYNLSGGGQMYTMDQANALYAQYSAVFAVQSSNSTMALDAILQYTGLPPRAVDLFKRQR